MLTLSNIKLVFITAVLLLGIGALSSVSKTNASAGVFLPKMYDKVGQQYLKCMTNAIYYEAGHEPHLGKIAVARVVMNRISHREFGDDPCEVVYQVDYVKTGYANKSKKLCQFSWVCDRNLMIKMDKERYQEAEQIARAVLTKNAWSDVLPSNVLFFHSTKINPNWSYERYIVIGGHVFYRDRNKSRKV